MTWAIKITAEGVEGPPGGNVCGGCKHSDGCQLHKTVGPIQDLLTRLDGRCDGTWANGEGELKCNGFEANEPDGEENPNNDTPPDSPAPEAAGGVGSHDPKWPNG